MCDVRDGEIGKGDASVPGSYDCGLQWARTCVRVYKTVQVKRRNGIFQKASRRKQGM